MSYIDGVVIGVATADKAKFVDHAQRMDRIMLEHGAIQVVDGWGDDVPDGTLTDFKRAVQAEEDETIVFGWVLWPDKATRDAGWAAMRQDERMNAEPMPFDGKRMIFGGFTTVVDLKA